MTLVTLRFLSFQNSRKFTPNLRKATQKSYVIKFLADLLFKYLLRLFYKISQPKTRNSVGFRPLKCLLLENTMKYII